MIRDTPTASQREYNEESEEIDGNGLSIFWVWIGIIIFVGGLTVTAALTCLIHWLYLYHPRLATELSMLVLASVPTFWFFLNLKSKPDLEGR